MAEGFLAGYHPQSAGAPPALDVVERDDADRVVVAGNRVETDEVTVPLRHDPQQRRRDALPAVTEIQPLVVLLALQPACRQLVVRGCLERPESHHGEPGLSTRPPRPAAATAPPPRRHSAS